MPPRGPLKTKLSLYPLPDRAKGFYEATHGRPTEVIDAVFITWPALPEGARERIVHETPGLPWEKAVQVARKIIEEAALDQFRARYMRKLPPKKQLELFGQK